MMNFTRHSMIAACLGTAALAMPAAAQCVDFDPVSAGSPWPCCGVVFNSDGVDFETRGFVFTNGASFFGGEAIHWNACNGAGGHSLWLSNVNVNVRLADFYGTPEVKRVKFFYADYGGSVNLRVNGVLAFTWNDFASIPAGFFPGAVVTTTPPIFTGSAWEGTVIIEAVPGACINDLAIGGQELCIDDICADPCGNPCPADFDGDGVIGFPDLVNLLSAWGPCGGCPQDLDGNGTVGFPDLVMLLSNWGGC